MSNISDLTHKKITMRLNKEFLKDLKRYAIDHDMTLTEVINQASYEFLKRNIQTLRS